jgi:translocation and assembly module TamB
VQLQGSALIQQRQIQSMNVRIDANTVRLRYPQGLRSVVNGGLVLRGSLDSPLLEGSLEIESMSYKDNFDEFLAMFSNASASETSSMLSNLRLALHVEGGRNITIQNQLADVEARVDLDIKGTVGNPSLTGHVEASGGTLAFQGKRYTITRGNVDFTDPLSIVPNVDIQAETEVRDYRIILAITGRGDNLHLDLRSDPALSQFEIVSLIAGGKTREELSQPTKPTPSEEAIFKGGAASILSDLLAQRIAGSAFEKLVPGRVRIGPDPDLISVRNQTTLRFTYDLQVSSSLSLTLSQDLEAGQATIIQIEYFVTKNTSILASRDETNNYSFDVKLRRRFK